MRIFALLFKPASRRGFHLTLLWALGLSVLLTGWDVAAFTAPAAGTLGYDVYNVVVTKLLTGPIGFVGAVILIVWGATQVMKQWLITILCVIAGTVIIKAQAIVTTLGALVPLHVHQVEHLGMLGKLFGT